MRRAGGPSPDIEPLLSQMTLDEKIGQMTQADMTALKDGRAVRDFFLGSVLSVATRSPSRMIRPPGPRWSTASRARRCRPDSEIPMIYGVDAVHGDGDVKGAVLFPHNIGLGATRNPDLVRGRRG